MPRRSVPASNAAAGGIDECVVDGFLNVHGEYRARSSSVQFGLEPEALRRLACAPELFVADDAGDFLDQVLFDGDIETAAATTCQPSAYGCTRMPRARDLLNPRIGHVHAQNVLRARRTTGFATAICSGASAR
jgi:hypothetical protein